MPNLVSIVGFPSKTMGSISTNGNVECESPAHDDSMERFLTDKETIPLLFLSKNVITLDNVLKVSGV